MATTSQYKTINLSEIKRAYKLSTYCSICQKEIRFGVERRIIKNTKCFPYAHIILHGDPIHALIVYIDAEFKIRGVECAQSIEILRDSETFTQILKKWSNPF